jgi:hypothetical protein
MDPPALLAPNKKFPEIIRGEALEWHPNSRMPTFPDIYFQLGQRTAGHLPSLDYTDDRVGYLESRLLAPGLALEQGVG